MRITTWNVNSIRTRIDRVLDWIARHRPDVLLLQETKCTDADFPTSRVVEAGYEVEHWGRDHWNGVAVLSKVGLNDVSRGFPGTNRSPYDEARLLSATCGGIRVHSLYAPNGRELDDPHYLYKLVWLERLRTVVDISRPTVLAGDFNVAPSDLDIYDPARWRRRTHASPPERAAIDALLDQGLRDVTREHLRGAGIYTWWGYRPNMFETNRGLRIDLMLCDDRVAEAVRGVEIDTEERAGERPSDHAPVTIEFDLAE